MSGLEELWWVLDALDNLTEDRYNLPISPGEAKKGTATDRSGPRPFSTIPLSIMAYLSHIGIAVENLDKLKPLFQILGMSIEGSEEVPTQGVRAHFVPLLAQGVDQPARVELLECTDTQGPIGKFISKKGPGVHHLAFGVAKGELDAVCEKIKAAGYSFTFAAPQRGAHNMRVNFVHPATTGGVLVEVMEPG